MKQPSGDFDIDKYIVKILPQPWLQHIPRPISHWVGYRRESPKKRPDVVIWLWTWIGAFCGVAVIEAVFQRNLYFSDRGVPIIVGSFVCNPIYVEFMIGCDGSPSLRCNRSSFRTTSRNFLRSHIPRNHRRHRHQNLPYK